MKCKECKHLNKIGTTRRTWRSQGRGIYYCSINDKFVGYGTNEGKDTEIKIKTRPRWCPERSKDV